MNPKKANKDVVEDNTLDLKLGFHLRVRRIGGWPLKEGDIQKGRSLVEQ